MTIKLEIDFDLVNLRFLVKKVNDIPYEKVPFKSLAGELRKVEITYLDEQGYGDPIIRMFAYRGQPYKMISISKQ